MSIAESHIRINDSAHEKRADAGKSRDIEQMHGERRDAGVSFAPRLRFHDADPLFRSETMFASAFAAQALVQALALARATPLEATRTYARPSASRRKPYLFV